MEDIDGIVRAYIMSRWGHVSQTEMSAVVAKVRRSLADTPEPNREEVEAAARKAGLSVLVKE